MRVGILGGGQLSHMLAISAQKLGLDISFYVDRHRAALNGLGPQFIGSINCQARLKDFLSQVDIITFENENIPEATLSFLDNYADMVHPCTQAIRIIQDRLKEKKLFKDLDINTNKFILVNTKKNAYQASEALGFPFVLKQRTNGYDGKGQYILHDQTELEELDEAVFDNMIAEEFIKYDREFSVIMARNSVGNTCVYDITENKHINGILFKSYNKKNDPKLEEASSYLKKILESLSYVGICAMEFFQVGDVLLANELAPRVHNSGHWTIEGSITSQFENHLRCVANLSLGDTCSYRKYAMYNIISSMPENLLISHDENIFLHDYLKEPRPDRKLGHITIALDTDAIDANQNLENFIVETLRSSV